MDFKCPLHIIYTQKYTQQEQHGNVCMFMSSYTYTVLYMWHLYTGAALTVLSCVVVEH